MVDEFISEEENEIAKFGNYHLTDNRIIKLVETKGNVDYLDIQLDKITSFDYSKKFNRAMAVFGGFIGLFGLLGFNTGMPEQLPPILVIIGLGMVIMAYLGINRTYIIHSDNDDVSMRLPDNESSVEFWKKINDEKNR